MTRLDEEQRGGPLSIFRKLIGRLTRCPLGKHSRSLRHVQKKGDQYTSRCYYRGIPMVRLQKRQWIVDVRRK